MIMHKFLLPGLLSALRIPLSLLLLVVEPLSPGFFALYALCGLSDMLDGPLARRLDCVSEFGARLDSFADFLFCTAALYRLLPAFVRRLPPLVWAGAALVLLLRLAGCIVARLRRRPLAPPHTQLNRLTGLLLFLLPPLLPSRAFLPLCHIICAVAILAAQEELFIRLYGTPDDNPSPADSPIDGLFASPESAAGSHSGFARLLFPFIRKRGAR